MGALISVNPFMKEVNELSPNIAGETDNGKPAIVIGINSQGVSDPLQGAGIHILCAPAGGSVDGDCRTAQFSETFWSENEIHSWAKTKVGLYSAGSIELGTAAGGVHATSGIGKGLILSSTLKSTYTPEEQFGIYARFAN